MRPASMTARATVTIAAISALAGAALQAVGSVETTHAARPLNQAQTTMVLSPSKDNTLYEDASGSLSNGRGQHFFVGKTGATTNRIRRGVIAFDVAGGIPAGSTIDSVILTLHMSRTQASAQTISVRRLLGDWGEGSSDAPGGATIADPEATGEGGGASASSGDATWTHSFFATDSWNAPGGDFLGSTRASASVGGVEFYSWSSAGLVSDVQGWLDDPSSNSGWLLQGNESQNQTTKRFDSRQNPVAANRPTLTVQYTPPPPTPTPTATATPTHDPNATPTPIVIPEAEVTPVPAQGGIVSLVQPISPAEIELSGLGVTLAVPQGAQRKTFQVSPNPPKDTDGRREGSGRGWVRELQGRWPGVLG